MNNLPAGAYPLQFGGTAKAKVEVEIIDLDLEALAEQVRQGFTSGRLDSETENMESKHIAWELKTEAWVE